MTNQPNELDFELSGIVVIGSSCSGKTTLAKQIAGELGSQHIELDAIHWMPDWVRRPSEELRKLTAEAVAQDRWVVDGNYLLVRDIVWVRATTVIWLDYSFPVVFFRALRRTLSRSLTGQELFSGNRESRAQAFFGKESVLQWVITTFHSRRGEFQQIIRDDEFPGLKFVRLHSQRETGWLIG
ncbi:MAG: AAA family ATPase [Chloroflexi bacterium]|nr:AAA family ATPase [Chloroflexota bacterium]MCI0895598.1 AAA family ATPase [Chloroflexota bacterium]